MDWDDDEDTERRRVAHDALREQARDVDAQNAMLYVLADKRGRQLVWDLLSHCGVFSGIFHRDLAELARREGRREIGVGLLAQLEGKYPGAYAQMRQEHQEREWRYESIQEPKVNDDE